MVKLTSGREVELRPLTIREKLDLQKRLMIAQKEGLSIDPLDALYFVSLSSGLSEDEIDKQDWSIEDVIECAGKVFEISSLSEVQKKN